MKKTAYFALFAALAVGSQAAVAQVADTVPAQRQQRMEMRNQRMADRMGMNHQRMQPGMQGGMQQGRLGFSPSALLRQQQSLGLAPEQVTQLEALRDQAQAANAEAVTQAQALLTDEQRGRVLGRGDAMRGRGGMQGRRGMRAQVHQGQNRSFRGMRGSQRGRGRRPN